MTDLYPSEIILEVTNHCNLRCQYCHFHGTGALRKRPLGFMKREIWERILDEIALWNRPVCLATHGAGEPLLYHDLPHLICQAKQIPYLTVGFMTNGMLLDDKWVRILLDANIDWIAFSIDGTVPNTHDHYRVHANLHQIEKNVMALIHEKEKRQTRLPSLRFNMVGYPEIFNQADDYVRKWLPFADAVTISKFRPMDSKKLWDASDEPPFQPCSLLYHQFVIGYDGQAGLCCEDIHLDVYIGNTVNQSIKDIYNTSRTLTAYRSCHEHKRIDALTLCKDCHVWGANIVLKEETLKIGDLATNKLITPSYHLYKKC